MHNTNFTKLDNLKAKLDAKRPLAKTVLKNLQDDLIIKWTFNSNAIEGNTLSLKETKIAIEGITVGGKSLREHFEAINHKDAILFIYDLVQKNQPLSELDIKAIHSLILKNIEQDNAGKYRNTNVFISGAEHKPPQALKVPILMQEFIQNHQELAKNTHPVELCALAHINFAGIHPFIDGNGRAARIITNLELIKKGFLPIIINVTDRLEYYKALDIAHTKKDYKPFMKLMFKVVEQSFEPYFFVLNL